MVEDKSDIVSAVRTDKNSLLDKYNIPVEHLSYEYISDCKNNKELERIVLILRSGEEGAYPDLLNHAEKRLRVIKPSSKILRKAQPAVRRDMLDLDEREELDNDISNWTREMQCREKDLKEGKSNLIGEPFPRQDIRRVDDSSKISQNNAAPPAQSRKQNRISSCDYAAWDKYDVDTEISRLDLQSEQERLKSKQTQKQREMERKKNPSKEVIMSDVSLTATELNLMATREREKGNEAFRAGDYEEALHLYNASIAMDGIATTYNNRAMTLIKLQRYAEALNDCNAVIAMENTNVKAFLRRALCFQHLEKNSQALVDYETVLKLEPSNKSAIAGVNKLRKPCESRKTRIKIEEEGAVVENGAVDDEGKSVERKEIIVSDLRPDANSGIGSDICFCHRAPGSSKNINPLPHIKASYCLETPKVPKSSVQFNDTNKQIKISQVSRLERPKSIFSYTSPLCSADSSEVIIKELPPDATCTESPDVKRSHDQKKYVFCETDDKTNENGSQHFQYIKSPYEFIRVWQSLKNDVDLKLHAKLLRSLAPNELPTVVGNKLDGTMLTQFLLCLERHFCRKEKADMLLDILKALSECSRFSIVNLFINSSDKKALANIFHFLEDERCPDIAALRQTYNI